jgi:hypothetical protein
MTTGAIVFGFTFLSIATIFNSLAILVHLRRSH